QFADERARRRDAVAAHRGVGERGAAAGDDSGGAERLDAVERRWPIAEIRVAGVRGRAVLDEVAREQYLLLRQPDDGVALGVAAAELHQPDLELAEPDRHLALERQRRPGQPGDRLDGAKEPREALD